MGQLIYGIVCLVIGVCLLAYSFGTEGLQFLSSLGGGALIGHGAVMVAFGSREL